MQNSGVAKPPKSSDSFSVPGRKPAAAPDYFLEPLPVPDATESNTDTAWGLWEHSIQAHEGSGIEATQPAELQDFPETEHGALVPEVRPEVAPLVRKSPKS